MITPKKFKLSNGLTVLVIPQKDSPSVTAAVMVRAGAAYENRRNSGISHFLEHMCFKGTAKRPRPIDISSEFDTMGASNNAFTSRDLTGYWAKVSYTHTEHVLELLSDMYLNPLFKKDEIEKEKGVIIEEINMYEDQPQDKVFHILDKLMYGNQPAGWSIAGPRENIRRITRDDFIRYRAAHYIAPKTTVVIAGNISAEKAKQLAQKYFSRVCPGRIVISKKVIGQQKKPAFVSHYKKLDQTHFAIGFKTFPLSSPKRYTLSLLADILGGSMSSRLFQKVREELGAAYYVGASASNLYVTHGYMDVFAGVNHDKAQLAVEATIKEIENIAAEGVTDKELARAKEHRIGRFLLSLETSSDLAFYYGEDYVTMGKIETPAQVIRKMRSVTKSDVARLARETLQEKKFNFAVVGPYESPDRFRKLLHLYK